MSTAPESPAETRLSFSLNGRPTTVAAPTDRSLLSVLREQCGLISPKNGCEPQASCGCCTVLIDGKPRLACAMKATAAQGRTVTTLEGLPAETRTELADCFVHAGGLQCGFCIPGFAMRTIALLEQNPSPTRPQITDAFRPHLCRCTGYTKIVDAVELLARARAGQPLPPPPAQCGVGARLPRFRGREFALGDFRYVDDIVIPGALFAAPRFSDHPRALLKSIDPRPALALPGVERVLTAADVPSQRFVGLIVNDWPIFVAPGEETRCIGDVIAFVVARDQHLARAAAAALHVEYEVRPPLTDPQAALAPDAPRLHPKGNLLARSAFQRGDVDAVLASSAHVVENTYTTQRIEHMFLEPEACIAIPDGDARALRILSQGQGVFDDQRQIASVLGWQPAQVQVELVSNGGAFGGKEDMSIQAQTALAAVLTGRPVKCTLTRDESFRLHPKRHPVRMHVKVGCDADGRLTAVRARIIGDKGAYASVGAKVLERAAGHAVGPYRVPNVDIEALAVYTNNPPCGAMRGFGANQAAFAIERSLDRLARLAGLDGWEIRYRNALVQGDRFCTGQRLEKPFGLQKTLLAVRDAYRGAKFAGIACGIKNVGIGNGLPEAGRAVIAIEAPDRITIRTGFTEMGQGYFTILIQTAVEETGLPAALFVPLTDTSVDVNCGQTTASRATVLGALAVIAAARQLKADLAAAGPDAEPAARLATLVGRKYVGLHETPPTDKPGTLTDNPRTHLTYGFATQVVLLDDQGALQKVIAAHDVGRVMNPTLLEGQMEGSIHMGLGYALTEDFPCEEGRLVNQTIKSLGVLRAHHMPEVECIFIEEPDPETAYGTRGVGEIGLVPTAPAVAGALEAFDGVHRTSLPMKDSPAARAILGRK